MILHLELPKERVTAERAPGFNPRLRKPITPSLQPYSGSVRVRTARRKTGGNFCERLFGTRQIKCRAAPGAPILRARRGHDATGAACCHGVVDARCHAVVELRF